MDAKPPSELFDRMDTEQAIQTARKVLSQVELFAQSPSQYIRNALEPGYWGLNKPQ